MFGITFGTEMTDQGEPPSPRLRRAGGGRESERGIRPRLVLSSPFCLFNLTATRAPTPAPNQ